MIARKRKEVYLHDAFLETEGTLIEIKESDDIFEGLSFRVPGLSIMLAVVHDVVVCFRWGSCMGM